MIADRLRALVAELRTPRPTWDDDVTFVSERDTDIADRLEQILAEDAGGWRSMDSAPKDGTRVLLFDPEGVYVGMWFEDGAPSEGDQPGWMGLVHDDSGITDLSPTHWRPLPEAPPQEPQP